MSGRRKTTCRKSTNGSNGNGGAAAGAAAPTGAPTLLRAATRLGAAQFLENSNIRRLARTSRNVRREAVPSLYAKFNLFNEIRAYIDKRESIAELRQKASRRKSTKQQTLDTYTAKIAALDAFFLHRLTEALEYSSVRQQINIAVPTNPDRFTKAETTPLEYAIFSVVEEGPNLDIIKALIAAGADVNQRNYRGLPLLHGVLRAYPIPELVQIILEAGADPNSVFEDKYSKTTTTPLDQINTLIRQAGEMGESATIYQIIHDMLRARGAKTFAELSGGA
jgi:hypothetical protein